MSAGNLDQATAGAPASLARCVCPPRYATLRDPGRPTLGGQVADVAEALGTPLMAWQRQVADTALEVDPATGRLAYREVGLTVPRQQGKTTLELAVMVHRCRTWARSRVLYAAQTRLHAHKGVGARGRQARAGRVADDGDPP